MRWMDSAALTFSLVYKSVKSKRCLLETLRSSSMSLVQDEFKLKSEQAIINYGTKDQKADVGAIRWDLRLAQQPEIIRTFQLEFNLNFAKFR